MAFTQLFQDSQYWSGLKDRPTKVLIKNLRYCVRSAGLRCAGTQGMSYWRKKKEFHANCN